MFGYIQMRRLQRWRRLLAHELKHVFSLKIADIARNTVSGEKISYLEGYFVNRTLDLIAAQY
jgi:hypothetical protein